MIALAPHPWGPPWCRWDGIRGSGKKRRREKTHAWNFQAIETFFFPLKLKTQINFTQTVKAKRNGGCDG